jgi:hypothetical protein
MIAAHEIETLPDWTVVNTNGAVLIGGPGCTP